MVSENSGWRPTVYHDTKPFWDGCASQRLLIARCQDCRFWHHPPNAVCPKCWSDNVGHEEVSGKAIVYSFTVTPPERSNTGKTKIQVWAELAEQKDLIIVAEIEGSAPREVSIGDAVSLAWRNVGGGMSVPVFRRSAG